MKGECRACGCTDLDCSGCIEKTGAPCSWVESDLCSACSTTPVWFEVGVALLAKGPLTLEPWQLQLLVEERFPKQAAKCRRTLKCKKPNRHRGNCWPHARKRGAP